MVDEVYKDAETGWKSRIGVKAGFCHPARRTNAPALLDKITVDYYGSSLPINQLANI